MIFSCVPIFDFGVGPVKPFIGTVVSSSIGPITTPRPTVSLDTSAYYERLENEISPLKDGILSNFVQLSGTVWIILGVITLGGALKDKNSPNLQSGLWQIVGGSMVLFAARFFDKIYNEGKFLTKIIRYSSSYAVIGGGLWMVWGVIVLAGALKDKTGPALQSGIWQIVGGGLIMAAAGMLAKVNTSLTSTY